ncbi:Excinuclease ABC C subunit domain protein [Modestobacter italicus]|uniref:Excinuclease ABC C subunit domain protein n=1 Tax=Modestobacter italicus (strain DSM 44449 / CECT 9708 / BC 501) TaxID=2732864 RepID=I4EVL6_MODI5|nr:nucleotide excision repair endonuclease [Modestobacter marinus]CCH87429.1 Excinuclease ABC C subunit domain protein [Modestobacter marinus]
MPARPDAVAALPAAPGVYRFRDAGGRVLYVGRAVALRRRVSSYWGDLRDRRHLRRMVQRVARIEALVCDSAHEAAWAERNLLERSLPPWNRIVGGLEVPVSIRLDASPEAPRLGLGSPHRTAPGVRCFGPYLGAGKVRLALSGLERLYPIGHAGPTRTAGERELARARGGHGTPVAQLAGAVASVLDREPAAVAAALAALTARRDAAAGAQAYEAAARLQQEIEAVEWVVAPQRVTAPGGEGDQDVTAWGDDVLVRLRIRDGRLHAWEQETCSRSAPGTRAPEGWVPFLRRNADLAARLAALPVS